MADDGAAGRGGATKNRAWPRHWTPAPMTAAEHRTPRIPDHTLARCVGKGSYGEVWLACNVLGGWRAVKVVHRASFDSERPYRREFEGIRRVEPISRTHPGHVAILQAGRNDEDGYFYYVMELADDAGAVEAERDAGAGMPDIEAYVPRTLKEDLLRRGRLGYDEWLRLALALTSGLEYLHGHGLVHRDIKPSNIVFVGGVPKFADIGLVTLADATCSVVGTEGYLPPEGPGSAQADVYGLGKVFYEAATGMDRRDFPELPPGWPPVGEAERLLEINAIVLKACRRDPKERYRSAGQLHAELLLLQAGKSVRRTHQLEVRLARFYRVAVVLLAVALLASGAYVWASMQKREAERSEARTREQLRESLLHQARALRLSRLPGQRLAALEALGKAGAIRIGPDVLSEAVRCLGLIDLRPIRQWTGDGPGLAEHTLEPGLDRVAIGGPDGTLTVRTLGEDRELLRLPGPGWPCLLTLFAPDGRHLVAKYHPLDREASNRTLVWELETGEVAWEVGEPVSLRSLAISPDGAWLAAGTPAGEVSIRRMTDGQGVQTFPAGEGLYALSFSPDGTRLAVASLGGEVGIRWAVDGSLLRVLEHGAAARGIAWHPDGARLAVPCDDWLVHFWDVETGRRAAVFAGHKAQVVTATFSQDGTLLATIGWDKAAGLWDVERAQALLMYPVSGGTRFVGFSPDARRLARFGDGRRAELLEVAHPSPVYRGLGIRDARIVSATVTGDGRYLAYATGRGVAIREVAAEGGAWTGLVSGAASAVRTGEGGRLLMAGEDGAGWVRLPGPGTEWGPAAGVETQRVWSEPVTGRIAPLGTDAAGRRMVVRADASTAVILEEGRDAGVAIRLVHDGLGSVALSGSGRWAATGGTFEGRTRVWDAVTGALLREWPGPGATVVAFQPGTERLLAIDGRGCRVFERESWELVHWIEALEEEAGGVGALPVEPPVAAVGEGSLVAVQWRVDEVQLIHPGRGEVLMRLEALGQVPLCWGPGDSRLYVRGQYAEVQVWDLDLVRRELASHGLYW